MTVRDVWQTNPMFRLVMTLIAGVGVAAIVGGVVMFAQVRANTEILREVRTDVNDLADRILYVERNRRGLVPGEP